MDGDQARKPYSGWNSWTCILPLSVRRPRERCWVGVGPSLRWVLQDSGAFPDLPGLDQLAPEQVVELGGGVDAASYLVRCPQRDVVVKLKSIGLEAEARALRPGSRTPHAFPRS